MGEFAFWVLGLAYAAMAVISYRYQLAFYALSFPLCDESQADRWLAACSSLCWPVTIAIESFVPLPRSVSVMRYGMKPRHRDVWVATFKSADWRETERQRLRTQIHEHIDAEVEETMKLRLPWRPREN